MSRRRIDHHRLILFTLIFTISAGRARGAAGVQFARELWGTDGAVLALARSANTLYVGGNFTTVGPVTGQGVPLERIDGGVMAGFPRVTGIVRAVCPDGAGGWYIGGDFTYVSESRRHGLAHIRNGRFLDSWAPVLDAPVEALTVDSGTLYVGGRFTAVNGTPRRAFAAFDAATGRLRPLDVRVTIAIPAFATVTAIAVHGTHVFIGGAFDTVNAIPRSNAAELDGTGTPTAWNPAPDRQVHAITVIDSTIYLGGQFSQCGDSSRVAVAAVDGRGRATAWAPRFELVGAGEISIRVLGFARVGNTLVVGGRFTSVDSLPRRSLAAFDLSTGLVTGFDPHVETKIGVPNVNGLASTSDGTIYAGGFFVTAAGGTDRPCLLAFDSDGHVKSWNPRSNGEVYAIAASSYGVYAGGRFESVGEWVTRTGLAALDLTTGRATAWDPAPYGSVYAIAPVAGKVYVGGYLFQLGGNWCPGLGAVDTLSGTVTWIPDSDDIVTGLATWQGRLYVGGYFSQMTGRRRHGCAAFDVATDTLLAWDPEPDDYVQCLSIANGRIYVGGYFQNIGGQPRNYLASLDPDFGAADEWNADPGWVVLSAATSDSLFYLGGSFRTVGGQPRETLAAVDLQSGGLSQWGADHLPVPSIQALAACNGVVYAGGNPNSGRPSLAAFRADVGSALDWWPDPDGAVWSLLATDDAVYVGGAFEAIAGHPCGGLAALTSPTVSGIPANGGLALAPCVPNPADATTLIRFELPAAEEVTLVVYDLQGRMQARVLNRVSLPAGAHEFSVDTHAWPAGCYFSRLETRQDRATRKMVIMR